MNRIIESTTDAPIICPICKREIQEGDYAFRTKTREILCEQCAGPDDEELIIY